jgi:molybdate transport system ATP-binding protein
MTSPPSPSLAFSVTDSIGGFALDATMEVGPSPVALVGPNGSGKTTLLLALLGIRKPSRGRITLDDEVLFDRERDVDVPPEERRFAYLPQDFGLFPHLTALHNVAFAIACRTPGQSRRERLRAASDCLERFGVAHLSDRHPAQLSGGERQRVALARAVATEPRALFLDEPTASLDVGARTEVRALLAESMRALAIPALIVTHDVGDVLALAPRVAVMEAGRIAACADRDAVRAAPPTAFAARLFGPVP